MLLLVGLYQFGQWGGNVRTFQEITEELGTVMNLVVQGKNNLEEVTKQADEEIKLANEKKYNASNELYSVQTRAVELRKEYESLMNELVSLEQSRVRQSK